MTHYSQKTKLHQPTSQNVPYLVVGQVEVPTSVEVGRRYDLTKNEYILSNQSDADIQIPSHVFPEHRVRLFLEKEGWFFEDLGERNDIYLNRFPSREGLLKDGDFLQIGQTIYQFLAGFGVQSDIFEAMHQAVRIDAHTKTYNKAHFWESIHQWVALSERYEQSLSLLMLDIDHFKKLNTDYGHLAADEVLRQFAHRIRSRLRKEDTFYRVGGEEFAAILPKTTKGKAISLAEELREGIEKEAFLFHQEEIQITISLGVCSYRRKMKGESMYEAADKRLREAKKTGRNKVVS